MSEQGELFVTENLERKNDVFYVRCRPRMKQALYIQMQKDGFTTMADWFDQWIPKVLGANNASNKKSVPRSNKRTKKTKALRR